MAKEKSMNIDNGNNPSEEVTPSLPVVTEEAQKSEKWGIIPFRPSITFKAMGHLQEFEKRFEQVDRSILVEMALEDFHKKYSSLLGTSGKLDSKDPVAKDFAESLGKVWAERGQTLI